MSTGTKSFRVYRAYDDAIEAKTLDQSDAFGRYLRTRDEAELSWVSGATVFWCRPLTVSERRYVANRASERDQYEAAFTLGLVKVIDLEYPDGSRKDWNRPTDHSGKEKPVPDDALDQFFDEACVQEIGSVIAQRSFLAHTRGVLYRLPDICRRVLEARLHRRVGQTTASARSVEIKSQPEVPPEAAPRSSPDGAASTGATATG